MSKPKPKNEVFCKVCEQRRADSFLSVMSRRGPTQGHPTDAKVLPCCRRCEGLALNAWDGVVALLSGET